jgi:hypothetical protein
MQLKKENTELRSRVAALEREKEQPRTVWQVRAVRAVLA